MDASGRLRAAACERQGRRPQSARETSSRSPEPAELTHRNCLLSGRDVRSDVPSLEASLATDAMPVSGLGRASWSGGSLESGMDATR